MTKRSFHGLKLRLGQDFYLFCLSLYKEYRIVFLVLILLQLITYTYFFSFPIFTDHTLSYGHAFITPYPSYRTHMEGRWFADIITLLQGGSGVLPFQMYIAVSLQSINGILLIKRTKIMACQRICICSR